MIRILGFVFTMISSPAFGLNCMYVSTSDLYQRAAEEEDVYLPVVGQIEFTQPIMPQDGFAPNSQSVSATIKGHALSKHGFTATYENSVIVHLNCAASWCGAINPDQTYLTLLRHEQDGLHIDVGPCHGWLIVAPTKDQITEFHNCHASGDCMEN